MIAIQSSCTRRAHDNRIEMMIVKGYITLLSRLKNGAISVLDKYSIFMIFGLNFNLTFFLWASSKLNKDRRMTYFIRDIEDKVFWVFLGLLGGSKVGCIFSKNAFNELHMNKLWIFEVLKIGVTKINLGLS